MFVWVLHLIPMLLLVQIASSLRRFLKSQHSHIGMSSCLGYNLKDLCQLIWTTVSIIKRSNYWQINLNLRKTPQLIELVEDDKDISKAIPLQQQRPNTTPLILILKICLAFRHQIRTAPYYARNITGYDSGRSMIGRGDTPNHKHPNESS